MPPGCPARLVERINALAQELEHTTACFGAFSGHEVERAGLACDGTFGDDGRARDEVREERVVRRLTVRGEVCDLSERRCVVAIKVFDEHRDGLEDVGLLSRAVGLLLKEAAVFFEGGEEGEQEIRVKLFARICQ